jgi:hypothetical protein
MSIPLLKKMIAGGLMRERAIGASYLGPVKSFSYAILLLFQIKFIS